MENKGTHQAQQVDPLNDSVDLGAPQLMHLAVTLVDSEGELIRHHRRRIFLRLGRVFLTTHCHGERLVKRL